MKATEGHRFGKSGRCLTCGCSRFVVETFAPVCSPARSADLTARWCSWCYSKNPHGLLKREKIGRNDYVCRSCGNHALECRSPKCRNMARGKCSPEGDGWFGKLKAASEDQFCAVHNGTISSFEKLNARISDISEHPRFKDRDAVNYTKAGRVLVGAAAAAAVVVPPALAAAAPVASALGATGVLASASTGTAISSLSGAALTSASLAALGGSVAGGTFVVAAAGTALGSTIGGIVANAYAREVKSYAVERINSGSGKGAAIVCIDGFLTEAEKALGNAWASGLEGEFPSNPWYHVRWESKCLRDLGRLGTLGMQGKGGQMLESLAKKATKTVPKGLGGTLAALQLAGNPWHVAMVKSMMTGALIADMLCRTRQRRDFILVGHSLGARVIFYALQNLAASSQKPRIRHAILLGGAVGADKEDWEIAASAVSGKIINCYSKHDDVLRYLYKFGTVFRSAPIGRNEIPIKLPKVENLDVSDLVKGHMRYKPCLADVMQEVATLT